MVFIIILFMIMIIIIIPMGKVYNEVPTLWRTKDSKQLRAYFYLGFCYENIINWLMPQRKKLIDLYRQ